MVRELRGSTMPRDEFGAGFEAVVAAVDRVWKSPVLQKFWRHGELVPNRSRKHPYQAKIPEKWRDVDRPVKGSAGILGNALAPPGV